MIGTIDDANEALELWTEGMLAEGYPIAATRTLQEILLDPESKDWLENFTMIVAMPNPFVGGIAA